MATAADQSEKLPFFLRGNYAPVDDEATLEDLRVEGEIPRSLRGRFVRNGPNPKGVRSPHWFFGDGMLHAVAIEDGRALWYRRRWVRTRQLSERPRMVGADGRRDLGAGPANTNVIRHAGRTLALAETTSPWEVTEQLETRGPWDFDGRLGTGMTAHPKACPATGELHFFDYDWFAPHLTWHVADASGALAKSVPLGVPGGTMMHDFAITVGANGGPGHAVFMDLPVVFDFERAIRGAMPYRWDASYGARLGVIPRDAATDAARWFDIDPCYVFHPMNAWEEDGRIAMLVARYEELWREDSGRFDLAFLHRWDIDLAAGTVRETPLDDRPIEFPRIDDALTGLRSRFGYAVRNLSSRDQDANSLLKFDLDRGTSVEHDFGTGRFPSEGVFARDPSRQDEDGGWILSCVYDAATDRSSYVILDAQRFDAPPVATIHLPFRVPFGFHGNWFDD